MKGFQIGIIRLGRGEVSYYDPLSKVHLTLHHPTADIFSYMNTARLKRAVRNGTIEIVAGTLAVPTFTTNFIQFPADQKEYSTKGVVQEDVKKTIPAENKEKISEETEK